MHVPAIAVTEPAAASRDLREGGRWTGSQRLKNAAIYWIIRGALALADALPARLLLALTMTAGWLLAFAPTSLCRRAELNLHGVVAPGDESRVARQSFVHAGRTLGLTLLLRRASVRASDHLALSDEELEVLRDALAEGRGALVVAAHYGLFEHIAAVVRERGLAPAIVVRESYDPRLDPLVDLHRTERGVQVLHRGRMGTRLLRALRKGRPVGLLPDLGPRVASCEVSFLGRSKVPWPVGPARIAQATRCPVVLATLRPLAGFPFYSLHFERLREEDHSDLTQLLASKLEGAIASAPEHWLWMARGLDG